jgi:hypothetical protein
MRGVEAGERIGLEEMRLTVRVRAEIDPRRVAALKRPVSRKRPRACELRFGVGSGRVGHELLAQLLVVERVDIGLGIGLQHNLANAEHAGVIAIAGDAHRELATGKVLLDQGRLPIAGDDARGSRLKLCLRLDKRARLAAFAGAFGERLHEGGKIVPTGDLVGASLGDSEGGRRHAGVAHEALRHGLVLRGRGRQWVGEEVGLVEQLAQRRHLRFARTAPHAFSDGKDDIVALARGEPRGKRLPAPHPDRLDAERRKRAGKGIDRLNRIELGHLLLGEAERAVVVAQVVHESNAHRTYPARGLRSRPTEPSGSV